MSTPYEDPCPSGERRHGFVVAMRAKRATGIGESAYEWVIVSRWGPDGLYLAFAWTGVSAPVDQAPIQLTPLGTALATRVDATSSTFMLADSLPEHITVAGEFLPATGYVCLYGRGADLRLESEGRLIRQSPGPAWYIEAVRVPWLGEFFQGVDEREDADPSSSQPDSSRLMQPTIRYRDAYLCGRDRRLR